jgi:hypothetical protein
LIEHEQSARGHPDRVNEPPSPHLGFTGSYERDPQGEATVTMAGPTYHINGAAPGFNHEQPSRLKAETFSIAVSC